MGFNLAGFAEGIHPALQDLAQKARAGREAEIQLRGLIYGGQDGDQGAMGRNTGLTAGTTPPPATATPGPPLPGAPPQAPAFAGPSAAGGPPAPSPMPGAMPMPQQGGPPPGAGPITAGAGGALGPTPQVQPNGPPQAPQGPGASPAMSGVAQPTGGNEFQDSQKTLKSIIMNLRQANPKARPAEILAAADGQIKMMKGLTSETSALLRFQAANLATDQRRDAALQKAETSEEAMRISVSNLRAKLDSAEKIARDHNITLREDTEAVVEGRHEDTATNADSRRDVANINGAARKSAAAISQAGASGRAAAYIAQRDRALDAGIDLKEWQTQVAAQLKEEGFDESYITKLFASEANSAAKAYKPAPAAPGGRPRQPLPAPPARRAGGGGAGGSYKNLADLQAAFKSGKVSSEQAQSIARQNGWAQ